MENKVDVISLNKKAWNKVARKYEKAKYGKINPLVEHFCDLLPKNGYILDLGAGTGLPFAKHFVEKGFSVLGVDISARMVELAQKNVPQAEFRELSMTDISYENEFDGVFSNYSLLLLDPTLFKEVAKKIVKSLKKNGIFYLALNEPEQDSTNLDEDVIVEIMGAKMYSRAYTEKEILDIFTPLGMKCLKIRRETIKSKEFGIEHALRFLFRKL
jgi:SAM-dependent methyltransferase